jgi:hypothetical protein
MGNTQARERLRPSAPGTTSEEAQARQQLGEAIKLKGEARSAVNAATARHNEAEAALETKREAFHEADQAHKSLIAKGGVEDDAALRSWHKREERRVLVEAQEATERQAGMELQTAQKIFDGRTDATRNAVGLVLAARADAQAKELEARWPSLVEDAVQLVAMKRKISSCGVRAPAHLDRLLSRSELFHLVSELPSFSEKCRRSIVEVDRVAEELQQDHRSAS